LVHPDILNTVSWPSLGLGVVQVTGAEMSCAIILPRQIIALASVRLDQLIVSDDVALSYPRREPLSSASPVSGDLLLIDLARTSSSVGLRLVRLAFQR
jgi:hypothetical protein